MSGFGAGVVVPVLRGPFRFMLLSGLARSDLVRLLSAWRQGGGAPAEGGAASASPARHLPGVAERLAQWFNPLQAERVHATLTAIERHGQHPSSRSGGGTPIDPTQLTQQVQATEQTLLDRWHTLTRQTEQGWSYSLLGLYATWRSEAEQTLAQTRAALRSQLARGPVPLQQLAALDALMEQTLAPQLQRVWAQLPQHLTAHAGDEALAALPPADETLASLNALVQAELQTALHPLLGLVQAAHAHVAAATSAPAQAQTDPNASS